jgi:hypothetical protein
VSALTAALPVGGAALSTLGAADDGPGAGGRAAGVAFVVQLDHHVGTQGGVLLVTADPLVQLGVRAGPGGKKPAVERHKYRVQAWAGRLAAAAVCSVDRPSARGLGVAGWHAEAMALEGLAQRRPGGAQLGRGGVDAAELFGQRKGAFSFGPVGEKAAGLPAQRVAMVPAPLLRSALSYERVLLEANVEQYAAAARMRLRLAA